MSILIRLEPAMFAISVIALSLAYIGNSWAIFRLRKYLYKYADEKQRKELE